MSTLSAVNVRRFVSARGHSRRFWAVSLRGSDVLVHSGRAGTAGRSHVLSFPDEPSAARHVGKLIREKTAEGFRKVL